MNDTDWQDLVERHLAWLEARDYALTTVRSRRRQLRRFRRWAVVAAPERLTDYSLLTLEEFRLDLHRYRKANGEPLGRGSKIQILLAIKGFFRWLTLIGRIPSNPAADVDLPRQPVRLPRAVLTVEEVERVLAYPDMTRREGLRDRAVLETLYSTGIRRSECAHLEIGDIDLERGLLLVRRGKGARGRYVPLGRRAAEWIERYLREARPLLVATPDDGRLFRSRRRTPLSPKGVGGLAHRAVVGSRIGKVGSCHLFRHTMATLMLEHGADIRYIQEILGHTQLSTTAIYTRVSIRHLQEVHQRCHPAG